MIISVPGTTNCSFAFAAVLVLAGPRQRVSGRSAMSVTIFCASATASRIRSFHVDVYPRRGEGLLGLHGHGASHDLELAT